MMHWLNRAPSIQLVQAGTTRYRVQHTKRRVSRTPFRLRCLWFWRDVCSYITPTPKPRPDPVAAEIARNATLIGRLEIAASIGSASAYGQLTDMAIDRVGVARRRAADEALKQLQANPQAARMLAQ